MVRDKKIEKTIMAFRWFLALTLPAFPAITIGLLLAMNLPPMVGDYLPCAFLGFVVPVIISIEVGICIYCGLTWVLVEEWVKNGRGRNGET